MKRMILVTFAFLGWSWYEMSGGADFEAGSHGVTLLARVESVPDVPGSGGVQPVEVARSDTSATALTEVVAASAGPAGLDPAALDTGTIQKAVLTDARGVTEPQKLSALSAPTAISDASAEPARDRNAAEVREAVSIDQRAVSGNRVNLRFGPGTDYAIVTQLLRGDEVEVLADRGDGWVKLRALDGNQVGWMSANFLVAAN